MIPYNPSSFNTNKTILEQILELKNWLINHPQYEVYYCNDNASLYPFMNTFSLANVPDNTNMDVGDLVVCNNAVYCTVISIDRDNGVFTAGYGVSFKGDTGAAGQQGYSLRVSSENYVDDVTAYHRNSLEPSHGTRENDTILFANGYVGIVTSLGAGATYYVTNRTVSFVGPQGPQGPQGPTGATGPQGPTGPAGADGNDGVSITNVAIDGNSHLIVTLSNGSSIDAGSVSSGGGANVVTLNALSGTLTNEEYNTLLNENSIIDYYVTNHKLYVKKQETSTEMRFDYLDQYDYISRYTINKSTKAYSHSYVKLTYTGIDSGTATSGQVLTANGNGGASWEDAGASVPSVSLNNIYSGTLNDADYNILANNENAYIIFTDSNSRKIIVRRFYETNNSLYYANMSINTSSTTGIGYIFIAIMKNTKSFTAERLVNTKYIRSWTIDSETATSGQVLTANGNGGASWQTPSGSTLYEHNIRIQGSNLNVGIKTITSSSSEINTTALLKTFLTGYGVDTAILTTGKYSAGSNYFMVFNIKITSSDTITCYVLQINGTNATTQDITSIITSVSDVVKQL